jgi:hypothetical protein
MEYPDTCIRGIAASDWVRELNGAFRATGAMFQFQKRKDCREDGWIEESVNWMDDEDAISFTLGMKKDDKITTKFKVGLALVPRHELDRIQKTYGSRVFKYERDSKPDNSYHGNLLVSDLSDEGGKPFKKLISDVLAFCAEVRLRNDPAPSSS